MFTGRFVVERGRASEQAMYFTYRPRFHTDGKLNPEGHLYIEMINIELGDDDRDSPRYLYWASDQLDKLNDRSTRSSANFASERMLLIREPRLAESFGMTHSAVCTSYFVRQGEAVMSGGRYLQPGSGASPHLPL
jgi:hypothetical protein